MKKLLLSSVFTLLAFVSMIAQDDAIAKYFSQYMEDDNFTSVYISQKMFQMIAKLDIDDPDYNEIKPMLNDIKGLRILVNETDPAKYYKESMSHINTKEYEVLMTVKDDGEDVRFLTKESNGIISELLLIVGGADEFVLLSFVGKLDLQKISKLANKLDVKGADHLDELKDTKH